MTVLLLIAAFAASATTGFIVGRALKILDDDTPCAPADGDDDSWPFPNDPYGF